MRKKLNILFLYLFIFVMCIGASFAWYAWRGEDIKVAVNFSGLDPYINYSATTIEGSAGITPSNTYTGGISNDITFNKKEEGQNFQVYGHVYLEINNSSSENIFKTSNLKWTLVSVTNSIETEISTGNFVGEQVTNKIPAYINFPLNSDNSTTYKAYIWIDNNSPMNTDISGETISVNVYSEASTIGADNEGKYNELYIRNIEYENAILKKINAFSSIYEITAYQVTNGSTPTQDDPNWINITSTTSTTESGYITTIEPNLELSLTNNICVKNSNGDITCKTIENDTFALTYDCTTNGGSTANTTEMVNYGTSADLTKTCSYSGWEFVGWNDNKDATTALSSYTMEATNGTLYAIYQKTFTATTRRNVEEVTGEDATVSCTIYNNDTPSCDITLPNNPYTFTDWEFNGWVISNDTNITTTETTLGSAPTTSLTLTSNVNLIATWKRDYTATFYTYEDNNTKNWKTYTDDCTAYNNNTCTFELPKIDEANPNVDISSIVGPDETTYQGVSTGMSNTTMTTTLNSNNLDYYSVYKGSWKATYTKENDNVLSIGKETDSCDTYKTYNGSSYVSSTCEVTLPDINVNDAFAILGWFDSTNTKKGDPGNIIDLESSQTFTAKAGNHNSSEFSYDNSNTSSVDCSDVTCMLDYLYLSIDTSSEGHLFTITLDGNGATTQNTSTIYEKYGTGIYLDSNYTNEMTTSSNPITIPTKTGREFAGYYNEKGTIQYIDVNGYITDNLTNKSFYNDKAKLYAMWNYIVTYDANGGSGAPSNQTKIHNSNLTLSSTQPTKDGYEFIGWATTSTATSVEYNAGGTYTNNADVTLYAVWEDVPEPPSEPPVAPEPTP